MAILTAERLAKSFPNKTLFEEVTFGVEAREKVGVIGLNGSGKSTLLKILAGVEAADEGQVVTGRDVSLAYLPQLPEFPTGMTALEAVFSGSEELRLLGAYEQACQKLGNGDQTQMDRVAKLSDQLEARGAWALETRAKTVLSALGLQQIERPVDTMSGGQRKLVALARALVSEPDLLLLDEPTNHLDIARIQWLESYLAKSTTTILMVTHDRFFLDRVTNRILEVEGQSVHSFQGNYGFYLEQKALREQHRAREAEREQTHLSRELAWLKQGPKARSTRQKARLKRAQELIDKPTEAAAQELKLGFGSRRLGKKLLKAQGLQARNLKPIDFQLHPGDRVGIVGPNGSGKTTFLELLTGRLESDQGTLECGSTLHLGYYRQDSTDFAPGTKVIEAVREVAEVLPMGDGRSLSAARLLEQFLFPGAMHYQAVDGLSGGERRRLELLRVLMDRPNWLILDEPTNDLDIETLIRLESYLDDFAGCVMVVSHDRYLLDRITTRTLLFEENGVREYIGLVSELDFEVPTPDPAPVRETTPRPTSPSPSRRKLSYKESRELETLEERIARDEARQVELQSLLSEPSADYAQVQGFYEELEAIAKRLEQDLERWAELEEIQEA